MWQLTVPIRASGEHNRDAVLEWLKDRSGLLQWFSSIITGALFLLTIFEQKPGFYGIGPILLIVALLCFTVALLSNVLCIWQISK